MNSIRTGGDIGPILVSHKGVGSLVTADKRIKELLRYFGKVRQKRIKKTFEHQGGFAWEP